MTHDHDPEHDGGVGDVVRVRDPNVLEEIYALRSAVWREAGAELPPEIRHAWRDEHDQTAEHYAVMCEGRVLAAARLTFHSCLSEAPDAGGFEGLGLPPGSVVSFNRLVVHPSVRGRGIGTRLIRVRVERAREAAAAYAIVYVIERSESDQVARLMRHGFQPLTAGFDIATDDWRQALMPLWLPLRVSPHTSARPPNPPSMHSGVVEQVPDPSGSSAGPRTAFRPSSCKPIGRLTGDECACTRVGADSSSVGWPREDD